MIFIAVGTGMSGEVDVIMPSLCETDLRTYTIELRHVSYCTVYYGCQLWALTSPRLCTATQQTVKYDPLAKQVQIPIFLEENYNFPSQRNQ